MSQLAGLDEARTPLAVADGLVARYLDLLRDHEPVVWTRLGAHDRDGDLPDVSAGGRAARSRALAELHAAVREARDAVPADPTGDDREAQGDLSLLADELEYRRFVADVRPRHETDPLAALETVASGLHELLRRTDLPADLQADRIRSALERARAVPRFLEDAGAALRAAPTPHLEVALGRLPGLVRLVRDELPARAVAAGSDAPGAAAAGAAAAEGLDAFAALLDELRAEGPAPWRLGPDDHAVTLRAALGTGMTPGDVASRAEVWLATVRAELAELAAAGWQRRFPGERLEADPDERIRRVLADVADTALPAAELVPEARRAVEEARAFAVATGLADIPAAERLTIIEAPSYLAGVAVAFITAPPPLEPDGGCVYYLSPVPDRWDADQATSFLREYNPAQLRSLALHEGYPGHFVQLEHAAQHPRLVRQLVTRSAFAEGWAVHVEREALAAGFGDDGSSAVPGDDYRLTQRKLELRIATNALLDVGLHAGDLDDAGAVELLTRRAFQEEAEARGKLTRAKVTSGQLCSYFVGGAELADLHRERLQVEGTGFDLRRFHQQLLSHGTPTVEVVRGALADPTAPTRRPFA